MSGPRISQGPRALAAPPAETSGRTSRRLERGRPLTPRAARALNARFATAPTAELLQWALRRFGRRIALASSFGAEDVVLIDMLWRIDPAVRVFTLDTLRLPTETYDVIDRVRARYGISIEIFYPDLAAVDAMVRERGYNAFYRSVEDRHACCHIRKVVPLSRALEGLDAWITGLRAEQSGTRADTALIEIDEAHGGIVKINPLAAWTTEQVWTYIREHDVPYNALHDRGYPSIGCAPCTRAVAPGEDPRAGRWWWEIDGPKECGIHLGHDAQGRPIAVRSSNSNTG